MRRTVFFKLLLVVILASGITAFFCFDLNRFVTLEYLRQTRQEYVSWYAAHPLPVITVYILIYIVMAAVSLPGAAVMTLAAGALFGFVAGTVAVSIASTVGATLACAAARYLLRDWVRARIGSRMGPVNRGVRREGAVYLFTLRLIPLFPFWLINLAMGLTSMRLWTFFWVSQLGMLGGTMVYVNAGRELARIESATAIMSPRLLAAFVLLGVFPLCMRRVVKGWRLRLLRRRRAAGRGAHEPLPV